MAIAPDPRFARPRTLFFGVGAQKAATSWLDAYLRAHPEICMPVRKEQHYWSTLAGAPGRDRLARARRKIARIEARSLWKRTTRSRRDRSVETAWRLSEQMLADRRGDHAAYADVLLQAWAGEPVVGEITPAYALLDTESYAEMAALNPDVRFLFVLRDPVSRLVSGVNMNVRKDQPRGRGDFSTRLAAALADPEDSSVLRSRYDLTIERLERAAPRERICYLFFETLFRQEEIDRLTDFLGVARRPAGLGEKVNAARRGGEKASEREIAQAVETLRPTYEFVRARFGDAVPPSWRRPAARRAAAV
ncbi:sulfotransferase [Amaricoccus sp.]|uniref:sulfotransferase n=1 Tax=Amaricoccus sp. TaxID=1872485 RepID=UPI001B59F885|nr:sulfotransferase [Amaricoccus sp.]MBP7000654.1 sulfotransferase [Amaricoccus sp.]